MSVEVDLDDEDVLLPDRSLVAVVGRRVTGHHHVDPWGLDRDLVDLLGSMPGLGRAVAVDGSHLLPDGPAVLVHDATPLGLERLWVAVGVGTAADRPVRCVGVPDVAPVVGALRRVGAVGRQPADLRGLLRRGHLVAVALGAVRARPGRTGPVPATVVAAALATGAPLVPVAVSSPRGLRRASLRIGDPVPTRQRSEARDAAEVAAQVRAGIAALSPVGAAT